MRADNTSHLIAASRERTERTRAKACDALAAMTDGPVTVARLATTAGVSRAWLYRQPHLLEQIDKLATTRPAHSTPNLPASQRASDTSLRQRLELAHQRIAQLTEDNRLLRNELANAYGAARAARQMSGSLGAVPPRRQR